MVKTNRATPEQKLAVETRESGIPVNGNIRFKLGERTLIKSAMKTEDRGSWQNCLVRLVTEESKRLGNFFKE